MKMEAAHAKAADARAGRVCNPPGRVFNAALRTSRGLILRWNIDLAFAAPGRIPGAAGCKPALPAQRSSLRNTATF